jgi:hypothetical protein
MVVRRCHDQEPYARVAQPFGRAGNALRLHCPTLFGSLPSARINSAAAAALANQRFGVLEWALDDIVLASGLHTVPLCAKGDFLEWCR